MGLDFENLYGRNTIGNTVSRPILMASSRSTIAPILENLLPSQIVRFLGVQHGLGRPGGGAAVTAFCIIRMASSRSSTIPVLR